MNYQVTGDCDSVLVQQESSVYVNDHKLRAGCVWPRALYCL